METRKLEQFLIKELSKGDMTYKQVQVIDYDTNNEIEEVTEHKYAHITINVLDGWDYRQLCEVSFLDGKVSYVSGTISGSTMRLLQEWVEKENKNEILK